MKLSACSLFGVLLPVLACLSAQAGWIEDRLDPATGEPETIIHLRLFDVPDPSRTDTATRADAAVVRAFRERFPALVREKYETRYRNAPDRYGRHHWDNVRVELHPYSGIQVEGVESDLLAIAGDVAPDVLYVNFRKSHTYIHQGFLHPLDREDDPYWRAMGEAEREFRLHPRIRPVIDRPGPDGTRHIWALPYGGALGKVFLYRKDLFDRAGLDYPTPDWTWEDLYRMARALSDPAEGIYGLRFTRGKHEAWHWMSFLWSAGGDALVRDPDTGDWTVAFDSPAAARALDFYTRLCTEPWQDARDRRHRGYVYQDPSMLLVKWQRGEIGMVASYITEQLFSTINPDVTGMVPVPVGPDGERGAELNSRMMGLYSGIEHPAVRDAAWEYMRFYGSRDAADIRTRIMVEGGLGRFVNPRYLRLFGYPELVRLSPPGWEDTFRIAIETGRPEPYGQHSQIIYVILTRPIQEARQMALQGELPAERQARLDVLRGLLRDAAGRARRDMLGDIPSDVRDRQAATATAFLIGVLILFGFAFAATYRHFTRAAASESAASPRHAGTLSLAMLMLAPALLSIGLWQYLPLFKGSFMAFQDYKIAGDSAWIGVQNFGQVLWDAAWWESVWHALRFSFLVMAITFLPPVILAILLQESPRFRVPLRVLYYLPAVMTGLVVTLLWKSFYEPGRSGTLNRIVLAIPAAAYWALALALLLLAALFARRLFIHNRPVLAGLFLLAGLALGWTCLRLSLPIIHHHPGPWWTLPLATRTDPTRWLGDPDSAMLACVIPMVWAGIGPGCLLYLAALKGVPDELYETADIDGASFIDKILFIIFPILKPLILINFIGVFISSWFNSTAHILAMTGGAADTEVAGLRIFYQAFIYLQFGPATAMAWILGFLLIGFTLYHLRILSRLAFRAYGAKP